MSANWAQGGQLPPQPQLSQRPSGPPQRRNTNPPPVCFNCGGPHFLVSCQQQSQAAPAGFVPPAPPRQQFPPPVNQNPPYQNGAQYQTVPATQPYGPPARQNSFGQPQQTYNNNNSTPAAPYDRPGYQAQPYNQYPQAPAPSPSQYVPPVPPQQYGPPAATPPYQRPAAASYRSNQYPAQNAPYAPTFQPPATPYQTPPPPQWNNTPQPSQFPFPQPQQPGPNFQRAYSGTPSQYPPQQPQQPQQLQREYSGTPSQHSHQQQAHQLQQAPQQQNQPQTQPQASSQPLGYGSRGFQPRRTSQTPASTQSNGQYNQQSQALNLKRRSTSSAPQPTEAKFFSQTGMPERQGLVASKASSVAKEQGPKATKLKPAISKGKQKAPSQAQEGEEGESPETQDGAEESDDEEGKFNWDLATVFNEPSPKETVALAQPLSASFKSTPVPLVQAWSMQVPSISRYARKDNVKEYSRSIRTAPQWSYLQEDPAFTDANMDGPLIPFEEVYTWSTVRHCQARLEGEDNGGAGGRKRSRSEGSEEGQIDEQEDVDNQIQLEAYTEPSPEARPTKRLKNEEIGEDQDEVMQSPEDMPPIIENARGGTPCLAPVDDDAWAPEPGESAESPVDPTEALLASLGVSGSPKPVQQELLGPYVTNDPAAQSGGRPSQTPGPGTAVNPPPRDVQVNNSVPTNNSFKSGPQNQPQIAQQNDAPPMNNTFGTSVQSQPPNAQTNHGLPMGNTYNEPQAQPPYPVPQNVPYQNGPPKNGPYNNPQYGAPVAPPYGNGPPTPSPNSQFAPQMGATMNTPYNGPPNNYQQPPAQYDTPQNASWGNAPPYNAPHGSQAYSQPQYGPPTTPYAGQPPYANPQYGPPANPPYQNQPPVNYQQGPSQYGQPMNAPSYAGGPPAQYGAPTQVSPVQYAPPQNAYSTDSYPNSQYTTPIPSTPYGNNLQNGQFPANPSQPPFGNAPPNVPPRQDSGYASARGSYSNGSGPSGYNNQNGPFTSGQQPSVNGQPPPINGSQPYMNGQRPPVNDANNQQWGNANPQAGHRSSDDSKNQERVSGYIDGTADDDDTAESTPLSPTSAEILGKHRKQTAENSDASTLSPTSAEILGKLRNPNGEKSDDSTQRSEMRRIKRPQPVVDEAYSRRW